MEFRWGAGGMVMVDALDRVAHNELHEAVERGGVERRLTDKQFVEYHAQRPQV